MEDVIRGKLPSLLTFNDGTQVNNSEDWKKRRKEVSDIAVNLCYGGMPPEPTYYEIEALCDRDDVNCYKITAGTEEKQLSFLLKIYKPEGNGVFPVIIDGDECWRYMTPTVIDTILERGYAVAVFNRLEIVKDLRDHSSSALFKVYPDIKSSTIAGWAWGIMRAVDAMYHIDYIDTDNIAVVGHSRGGKASLLAGAYDERIKFVGTNGSGAGGAGCWKYERKDRVEDTAPENDRSELLSDLFRNFPCWMGEEMEKYIGKEDELPFDQHFFKAMCAPRYFIETEGLADTWANPKGAMLTYKAAKEVYKLFGAEDRMKIRFRKGGHFHRLEDFEMLLNVMDHEIKGTEYSEEFDFDPFPDMESII